MLRVGLLACFTAAFSLTILAQDDAVHTIVNNDPFDPERGVVEMEDTEATPIVEDIVVEDHDLPVLDGIILLGKSRMALFSNVVNQDGQSTNQTIRLNGNIAGYTVTTIERDHVVLSTNGNQTTLRLFTGKKPNRGGTKQRTAPNVAKRAPEPHSVTKEGASQVRQKDSAEPATTQTNTDSQRKNPPRRI